VSPEEYLERERHAESKSEYRDGLMVAMAGATRRHNRINARLTRLLEAGLGAHGCELYSK
jgi:Uma2 family endonuclease